MRYPEAVQGGAQEHRGGCKRSNHVGRLPAADRAFGPYFGNPKVWSTASPVPLPGVSAWLSVGEIFGDPGPAKCFIAS